MTDAEKLDTPHAVYRIYAADETLLYIGCSSAIGKRLGAHISSQPWRLQIEKITVKWYKGWLVAAKAEAEAIITEKPKYNKAVFPVDSIGTQTNNLNNSRPEKLRGDGIHCPKCGNEKENRHNAYCRSCGKKYDRAYRMRLGWLPRLPPTTVCPRCKGIKEAGPSYCKPCNREVSRLRRERLKNFSVPRNNP